MMLQVADVASAVAKIKGWFSSIRLTQSVSQVQAQTVQGDAGAVELSQNAIINSSVHVGGRIRVIVETHGVRMPVF